MLSIKELRRERKRLFGETAAHPYVTVVVLYLLMYGASIVFQIISVYLQVGSGKLSAAAMLFAAVLYIVYIMFLIWACLSMNWYCMRISRGKTPGDAFKMSFKNILGYTVYTVLYSLLCIAAVIVPFIIFIVLTAVHGNAFLIILFALATLLVAVYMSLAFSLNPCCYYDRGDKSIKETVKSNFNVTKGHKPRILKTMLVYYIPMVVIYAVAVGCFIYLAFAIKQQKPAGGTMVGLALIMVAAFIGAAVYIVWMLPNVITDLCLIYNHITGYEPESITGDSQESVVSEDEEAPDTQEDTEV